MKIENCKIYLVTDEKSCNGKDFYDCVEKTIKGGVKIVQLREKNISTKEFYEKALKVKEVCKRYGVHGYSTGCKSGWGSFRAI